MSSSSSTGSSSSGDIIRTGKSSLVFQTPVKSPERAVWSATLDLDAIDTVKMRSTAWHYIDMSGTYASYVIRVSRVKVEDGAKLSIVITPRRLATQEGAIVSAWQEVLLSRVRAALNDIRAEHDAAMAPGDAPFGHTL